MFVSSGCVRRKPSEEEKPSLRCPCCVPASAVCSDYSRMPWQHSLAPSPVLSNGSLNEGTLPSISKSCDGPVTPCPHPLRLTQPALLCRCLHSPPVPSRDGRCGAESGPSWVWVQLTRCGCHGNSTLMQWISHHQYPPSPSSSQVEQQTTPTTLSPLSPPQPMVQQNGEYTWWCGVVAAEGGLLSQVVGVCVLVCAVWVRFRQETGCRPSTGFILRV